MQSKEKEIESQREKAAVIENALTSILEMIEKFDTPEVRNQVIEGELRVLYSLANLHGYCEGIRSGGILHTRDNEAREIKQAEEALGIV